MRVLVTGSGGFLGGVIGRGLRAEGHSVFGADVRGSDAEAGHVTIDLERSDQYEALTPVLPLDAVVHAAALVPNHCPEDRVLIHNQQVALNLSFWMRRQQVGRLVHLSSCAVYGRSCEMSEATETMSAPESLYGISKLACELLFDAVLKPQGVRACHLRISAPFGPSQRVATVVTRFMRQALFEDRIEVWGSGGRTQDFVREEDVARAVSLALSCGAEGAINLTGEAISMRALADLCRQVSGRSVEVVFRGDDPQETFRARYSSEKARRDLGYRPQAPLGEALRSLALAMKKSHSRPALEG